MALMKVRYHGLSDYRILKAQQLEDDFGIKIEEHTPVPKNVAERMARDLDSVHEIDAKRDLVWGPHNGQCLTVDVNEDLERVLRGEGHFSLSAITDSGGENLEAAETSHEDAPTKVVANVDGVTQTSTVDPF